MAFSPHHTSHHTSRIIVTSDITSHHITHHKPKEENTKKKFLGRVLGPNGILTTSHIITSQHIRHHKPKDAISPHHTSHIIVTSDITSHHITHHKPKEENTKKKFLGRVLGPNGILTTSHITSHITHHCDIRHHISPYHTSQAERREHKEEVLGPSSWAGWHSHHITHHHISPHQTSQAERAKKYEFYCENVVQEHPRRTKSTRIITKNEHRRS